MSTFRNIKDKYNLRGWRLLYSSSHQPYLSIFDPIHNSLEYRFYLCKNDANHWNIERAARRRENKSDTSYTNTESHQYLLAVKICELLSNHKSANGSQQNKNSH